MVEIRNNNFLLKLHKNFKATKYFPPDFFGSKQCNFNLEITKSLERTSKLIRRSDRIIRNSYKAMRPIEEVIFPDIKKVPCRQPSKKTLHNRKVKSSVEIPRFIHKRIPLRILDNNENVTSRNTAYFGNHDNTQKLSTSRPIIIKKKPTLKIMKRVKSRIKLQRQYANKNQINENQEGTNVFTFTFGAKNNKSQII